MDKIDNMLTQPEVSVVIPLFNAAAFITRAVASALAQTYPVKEIIIVDDGSTDEPEIALKPYQKNIRYLRFENRGAAHARNVGIKAATGTLIAFLDADDEWEPEKIAKQVKVLLERNAALVYCGRTDIDEQGRLLEEFEQSEYPQGSIFSRLIENNHISSASVVLVRKAVLEEQGGFCEEKAFTVSEDFELWCRIALAYNIGVVPERLVRYRIHEANVSNNKKACYHGKIEALHRLLTLLECTSVSPEGSRLKDQVRVKILDTHHHYAWGFVQQGDYREARNALAALRGTRIRIGWQFRAVQCLPDGLLYKVQQGVRILKKIRQALQKMSPT